ncbi:MAG TPA: MFS transporter [Patescibacteria group bacterium]|nr:MFS transporter [Patescibacteria group bacterium]
MLRKNPNKLRRHILYLIGFIMATSVAILSYVQSNFLQDYIGIEFVSLFFVIGNLFTILTISIFPKIIYKLGNYFTSKTVIILYAASLIGLAAANGPISAVFALLLFIITSNLVWINIDIFLEEVTSDKDTGKIRTTFLTCANLGWIIGPAISAYLIEMGGYSLSFLSSALLIVPLFLIIVIKKNNLKDRVKKTKQGARKSFEKLWKNKNLRGVFIAAVALNIFFSAAVLYIPLYLHQSLGMTWTQLGWVFSFMLLPFILFEIPVGLTADKYLGEKEMMLIGLLILFSSLLLFYYIKTPLPIIWATALFFSRIGAAMVEATRDTYFFKNVSSKDMGLINVFRMTTPIGYLIGALLGSLTLFFLPINSVFLVLAITLIPAFYSIALINDTK